MKALPTRIVRRPPSLLPAALAPLIGRAAELQALLKLLRESRLITLTGAGGSGKTRLALDLAAMAAPRYAAGSFWVSLAALRDPELLPAHVCATLGVAEARDRSPIDLLIETIAGSRTLLVLDNCEHLIDACATLVERLLHGTRRLTILTTSRQALAVTGERTWLVPPLAVRDQENVPDLSAVSRSPAVQLFLERARAVMPGFSLTEANVEAVASICRRLDGLPLAIELAAARVRALAPEQIARRLDNILATSPVGPDGARSRPRTLRETIDWSYHLLTPAEQAMFQRVSVFAGSFSLDSVEQVCADETCPVDQTIDLVSALVDKSLVVCEIAGDSARYRLLDTIRHFARAELQRGGRLEAFRERAAVHFVLMAEAAEPRIFGGPDDLRLQTCLEAEAQNFRAVGEWCREDPSRSSWALRLGAALYWFWFSQGRFHEGRQLLDSALEADAGAAPELRARALSARGYMAMWQGDVRGMRPPLEESLQLMPDGGDGRSRAVAIAGMAMAALAERNLAEATEHIDRASALVETLTPPGVYLPFVLYWRGTIAIQAGERQIARAVLERAVSAGRELEHPRAIAHPLYALANLEIQEGRHAEAMNHLRESLQLHDRLGDGWGMFLALAGMAAAAADQDAEQAARLLGASEAVRSRLGIQMLQSVRPDHDDLVHRVRAAVGPGRFEALWRKGHAWSRPELLAELIGPQRRDSRHPAGGRSAALEASPELRVAALGRFEVYRGHTHVDERSWGSAKARELLAYLLAHPGGCTRERAGAALWPDASDEQVRNNFHVTVHRLRRALGDAEYIVIDRERYAINPARRVEFDAREFAVEARRLIEQFRTPGTVPPWAAATLARYRGEFLEHERAAEWHLDIRDELGQLYEQALVTVADALVATGRAADSLAYYRTLVSRDRTSERAARGLMRACLATGDRDTARRTYERLVLALREDLDTAPEAQTVDLARTLDATRDA